MSSGREGPAPASTPEGHLNAAAEHLVTDTAPPTASPDPTDAHDLPATTASRRVPRFVTASAWAVPIMVLGQFAFLAAVPVVLMLRRVLRDPRLGALRWPASLLAAVYAIPFAFWLLDPGRAQSLSKDISPAFVVLIVVASALLLTTIWSAGRRRGR